MTDQDYIKAGIELADGWSIKGDTGIYGPDGFRMGWVDKPFQFGLDALAAQLVRQVDAIYGVEFVQDRWKSEVHDFRTKGGVDYYAERTPILHDDEQPHRTMNTIKAIVDSGVLESSDG